MKRTMMLIRHEDVNKDKFIHEDNDFKVDARVHFGILNREYGSS
jgi:hypothetical protein